MDDYTRGLLENTFKVANSIVWDDYPLDQIDKYFDKDLVAYGTNLDERSLDLPSFIHLIQEQRKQSIGLTISWTWKPVSRRIIGNDSTAVFIDEADCKIGTDSNEIKLQFRLTWVLEYVNNTWKVIHLHGALPVNTQSDSWLQEELRKKNDELNRQVEKKTKDLQESILHLKRTQNQLIQSEKMASLGELTAGIAHEIQNPLNFVNNFSEVNSELIAEMKEELIKGNVEEARKIAEDIDENEKKIMFHGKRADGIVKGMLQHSRSSSGVKEPTDINVLADEYLRLAYHGLRAKDKSFNATMKTNFDESIGKINVVPQDIGRVILNLITNAFYAVTERKRQQADRFEPTVTVTTKKKGNKVFIVVEDNGPGIPKHIIDKIFQPFFTTKPTGQGTGLGLSMSYDIITKVHAGELKVETKEGEGSTFIIILPQ